MATDFAVRTHFDALGNIERKFSKWGRAGKKFGNDTTRAFSKASRAGSRFGDITKGILTADLITRAARGLWDMAKGAVQLASDLTEVQNVVDTTFGPDAERINQWSQSAIEAFGLSELQAKKFTGTLGAMLKSSGITGKGLVDMSTNLVGLAGDMASFFNLPIDQAFEKIRSGISGETEPLKQLGINMSVANLEAFALTQGIKKQFRAMTQAQKTQLRYNFLMKASKDSQGDFAKTLSTSMANQQRVLETRLKQAGATIMKGIVPMVTKAMKIINEKLATLDFDKIAKSVESGVKSFINLAGILINLAPFFIPIVAGMLAYNAAMKVQLALGAVGHFLKFARVFLIMARAKGIATAATWAFNTAMMANPVGLVIAGIVALIALLVVLQKKFDIIGKAKKFLGFGETEHVSKAPKGITLGRKFPESTTESPASAPNKEEARAQNINFNGRIDIANAPQGSTSSSKTSGAAPVNMNLLGAN